MTFFSLCSLSCMFMFACFDPLHFFMSLCISPPTVTCLSGTVYPLFFANSKVVFFSDTHFSPFFFLKQKIMSASLGDVYSGPKICIAFLYISYFNFYFPLSVPFLNFCLTFRPFFFSPLCSIAEPDHFDPSTDPTCQFDTVPDQDPTE